MTSFYESIDKFKIPIALSLVGIVLIAGGLIFSNNKKSPAAKEFPKESLVQSEKQIKVDVSGAVNFPGVYSLDSTARVEDAIKAAQGLSENANSEYIAKNIDLAQKISDGMKIYIPYQGETGTQISGQVGGVAAVGGSGVVNINTASPSDLDALPGIGAVTSAKIISGRPYQSVDDLLTQKIVSKSVFDKIKNQITTY